MKEKAIRVVRQDNDKSETGVKAKSVTKTTAMKAFHQARQVQEAESCVSDPKKLGLLVQVIYIQFFFGLACARKNLKIFENGFICQS